MTEQQRTIRRLAGYVPAEGEPIQPDYRDREQEIARAEMEWRDTTIYPRANIRAARKERLQVYEGHLRDYATDGSVHVVESSMIAEEWGGQVVKNRVLRVPPEGASVRTIDAIRLLNEYPLLLDIVPPPEPEPTPEPTPEPEPETDNKARKR